MGFLSRFTSKLKKSVSSNDDFEIPEEIDDGYVEINTEQSSAASRAKIIVKPYILQHFDDVKPILDDLREGYTIAVVNISSLKNKDLVELKRAVNKLKKTCEAIEGDIAGFGDDWITVVPSFATIHREQKMPEPGPTPSIQTLNNDFDQGQY